MIYVRHPTDEEHIELQRMTRQEVGRVSQRAQMVLLSAQRRSVPEIAAIFALRKATVRQWLHRFDVAGPAGLCDAARAGDPAKSPRWCGTPWRRWSRRTRPRRVTWPRSGPLPCWCWPCARNWASV